MHVNRRPASIVWIAALASLMSLGACRGGSQPIAGWELSGKADTSRGGDFAATALDRYVDKPDPAYRFDVIGKPVVGKKGTKIQLVNMISQQWRSPGEVDRVLWQHDMFVVEPPAAQRASTAILIIGGGSNGKDPRPKPELEAIAAATGAVVASVSQIPNQPLRFAGQQPRKEDEIIAYSFARFLDTGDEEWPAHLAMTKAAVRAMDTVQALQGQVEEFIVVGASKRGWTTWLVAAVDARVKAIAPISIDMLNLGQQFDHHWESYGFYAPAVRDYAALDIPCRLKSAAGQALLGIIDPHAYRDRYQMPKLVISSAGDQFFLPDSSQLYFSGLPQPRKMRYTVNTDHSQDSDGDTIAPLVAWIADVIAGRDGPRFSWELDADGAISVVTETRPTKVLLWQASNPTARDFRLETLGAAWTSTELAPDPSRGGAYVGRVTSPAQGWTAFVVELTFGEARARQVYTTDVRVIPEALPFKGTHCQASAS